VGKRKAVVFKSSVYVRSAATTRSQPLDGLLSHSRNELQLSAEVTYQPVCDTILYIIYYIIYIYIYIIFYYIILYYSVTNRYQRWLTIAQERSDYIRSKESSMTG
jgi:hypothetical protein